MTHLYTTYTNYKNIIINKLIKTLQIYNNNLINIYKFNNYYKKTPLEFIKYLYKTYINKNKITKKINKNITKKLDRDDFDILLDFANIKTKNIKTPIYGILLNSNIRENIYKILYYNNKKIKFITIDTILTFNKNKISLYIGSYKNIFIYINEIYNILRLKSNNKYISSKYALLIIYNSIVFSIIYINNINKLNYSLSNILTIAKKISNFIQIMKCNNEMTIEKNNIYSLYDINIINISLIKYNINECDYCPTPISISSYARKKDNLNILSLNNNKTNKPAALLNSIYMKEKINWSVDSNINIIFSNLTLIGSGWYRLFYNY